MMKLFTRIPVIAMMGLFISSTSQSQGITTPRTPSPAATVSQNVGISTVTINYSRPSVNDREIWGKLVPYGWNVQGFGSGNSAPWRAGANENTTITLSHEGTIQGTKVPAGTYGLFYTINPDNSGEVILSKDNRSWGSYFYEKEHDQLKEKIQIRNISNTNLLTYDFMNNSKNETELVLNWEKKQFPVKIGFAVDEIVMANAEEELKGPLGFSWQGYVSAANYALQNKVNYNQALAWADKAIAQNKTFATLSVKANLLNAKGEMAAGDKTMNDAMPIATEAELNAYGYQMLGGKRYDEAIRIFILNTQRHPKSANAFDSLGEGYATKGDKKNAIINFKKSLSMDPPDAVKANSEKFLKDLGAMK